MANKFVSFLASFGQFVLRGLNIIPAVTTVLESSAGQPIPVLDKLSQVGSLVQEAEVIIGGIMGPGSGAQKAAGIAPLVAQVVMSSSLVAGRKISPDKMAAFNAACLSLGGTVADILNCLEPDNAQISTSSIAAPIMPTAVLGPATLTPIAAAVTRAPIAATPTPVPAAPAPILDDPLTAEHAPSVIAAMQAGAGLSALPQD